LTDVQDYERRNIDSLSAWLLGSDRPLPEMEALVRAANLPLQKIRQRIANPSEIGGEAVSPLPQPDSVRNHRHREASMRSVRRIDGWGNITFNDRHGESRSTSLVTGSSLP
jgi:hypothetical protein